jgi:hypothetical protein
MVDGWSSAMHQEWRISTYLPTTVISRSSLSVSSPIRPLRPVRISLLAARRIGEKGTPPASRTERRRRKGARHGVPARRSGRWWVVDVPVPVQLGFSVVDAGRDGEGCDPAVI